MGDMQKMQKKTKPVSYKEMMKHKENALLEYIKEEEKEDVKKRKEKQID